MYAAKSFEQPPRRRSSPAPNRNPLQPLLELLVGARYIAPQNAAPAPLQPRYSYQSRTDSVPLSYQSHFPLSRCISAPCASLPKNTPGGIPFLSFHSSATRDLPSIQNEARPAPSRAIPHHRSQVFFPLPPSAHPRLYFRAKGDSHDTD